MADTPGSPTTHGSTPVTGSKLMLGLTGLNSLLLVGVLAAVVLRAPPRSAVAKETAHGQQPPAEPPGARAAAGANAAGVPHGEGDRDTSPARPAVMLQLPDFVVHLRDADTDRYARLTLDVELGAEQDKEAINARLPQIRDAFLGYLSDRSVDELRGSEGIGLVKQDLAKKLSELVPAAAVRALYVTDIVIQ